MAVNSSADIAAALSLLYPRPLTSQINWSNVLIHLIPLLPGAGKSCNMTAQFTGKANAAAVAETAVYALSDTDHEIEVGANLAWANYSPPPSAVTGVAEAVAATTNPNASLLPGLPSLLASRARTDYGRLLRGINGQLFAGQAAQTPMQIVGLAQSVDSTGSYFGIDPSTYTEWVSTEASLAYTDLSFNKLETDLLTPIYTACGMAPTALVCPPNIWAMLKALYGSNAVPYVREFTIPSPMRADDPTPRQSRTVKLDAGMDTFSINGIPVFRDRDCTANTIYALNLNHLWLEQVPRTELATQSDADIARILRSLVGSAADRLGSKVFEEIRDSILNPVGVVPTFRDLGRTGDHDSILTTCTVQMVNNRRNAHGKLAITGL